MKIPTLIDIADMPGFNHASNSQGIEQRDVSNGLVYWTSKNKVTCLGHGAMNAVNEDRSLWRCLQMGCNRGAFAIWNKLISEQKDGA